MKLHTISLGCQMSAADGEEMSRPLARRGFSAADSLEEADAVLLNTCTVRQHAEDRAVSLIGRLKPWKDARPDRLLIVAGCAAERLGPWLRRRFPHVDLVVGAKSIEDYPAVLKEALEGRFDHARENRVWPAETEPPYPSGVSQYVTIMRGCNYTCAYCIVPAVRGRERYRPLEAVLAEARARVAAGARELTLLGQTVNSYRPEAGGDFAGLLRALEAVEGLARVRFMSPHPRWVDERMIEAMASSSKVCPHLHLPAQSGSDAVLRRMRRNYTAEGFLARVGRLRAAMPGIELTTDFIVGFPGESEGDFEETLALVRALDPVSAYCFKFSPREGTEAAAMDGQVPEEIRESRLARLLEVVDAGIARHLAAKVGKTVRVLLEEPRFGRTEGYFKASLDRPGEPGETVERMVRGTTKATLLLA